MNYYSDSQSLNSVHTHLEGDEMFSVGRKILSSSKVSYGYLGFILSRGKKISSNKKTGFELSPFVQLDFKLFHNESNHSQRETIEDNRWMQTDTAYTVTTNLPESYEKFQALKIGGAHVSYGFNVALPIKIQRLELTPFGRFGFNTALRVMDNWDYSSSDTTNANRGFPTNSLPEADKLMFLPFYELGLRVRYKKG